jgi:drug/metabolite transporter (DMT)-like permease
MIFYIILNIITSSLLFVILKSFKKWNVHTLTAITINYFTAGSIGFAQTKDSLLSFNESSSALWAAIFIIGFLYITVFQLLAKTSQNAGVAVASIALKMSMVIPIFLGWYLYNDNISLLKGIGLGMSIVAVSLASFDRKSKDLKHSGLLMPLLLFLGGGLVDSSLKYTQHHLLNDGNLNFALSGSLFVASIFGLFFMISNKKLNFKSINYQTVLGGLVLGLFNYFSLFALLKALSIEGAESSSIFAILNVGVVLTSVILAVIIFKETLDKLRLAGITCAILAILFLTVL